MLRSILLMVILLTVCQAFPVKVCAVELRKAVIELPSACYEVQGVDCTSDDKRVCKVFAVRKKKECIDVAAPAVVEVTKDAKEAELYVEGRFSKRLKLKEFDLDGVVGLFDRADEIGKNRGSIQCDNTQAKQKAQDLKRYFYSAEYQKRLKSEKERIKKEVLSNLKGYRDYKDALNEEKTPIKRGVLKKDERIYLFVSSSIPEEVIRRYIRDIDLLQEPNIKIVMRGFIGGIKYIRPTMKYISGLLKKDEDCDLLKDNCELYNTSINIDPLLFRRYGIERVPAVVYVMGVSPVDAHLSEGIERNTKIMGKAYRVYGDASLEYILSYINREAKSKSLDELIERFREGFYH